MNANARELAAGFDLEKLTPEFYANPYPTYRALREHEPVKRLPNGSYFLTRYDDLVTAYKNTKVVLLRQEARVRAEIRRLAALRAPHHQPRLQRPAGAHARAAADHGRAVAARDRGDGARSDRAGRSACSTRIAAKGKVDLIDDFAAAIPVEVIGNLLDVPHEEREPLRDWSLAILGALEPVIGAGSVARGNKAVEDFLAYLEILVARRRAKPGDPERDVLTRLIQGEDNGERLTEKELLHNCIFLLNAGHETTTNLIGNGLVALSEHPDREAAADRTARR